MHVSLYSAWTERVDNQHGKHICDPKGGVLISNISSTQLNVNYNTNIYPNACSVYITLAAKVQKNHCMPLYTTDAEQDRRKLHTCIFNRWLILWLAVTTSLISADLCCYYQSLLTKKTLIIDTCTVYTEWHTPTY